jgi:P27 family predicted phage terminase small subunit
VPELLRLGVLTVVDGKALAAYCHAFARWLQAEREIQRLGLVLRESVFGTFRDEDDEEEIPIVVGYKYKRNPAVAISNEALKLMKSFLVEFGMTPAARTRIRVEKPPEEDPFESYMSRGGQSATKLVN